MRTPFSVNNYGMKRFIFAVFLTAVIFGVMLYFIPQSMQSDVFNYSQYNPAVTVYCRKTSCQAVDTGLGYLATCSLADFKSTVACCRYVDGVSVTFAGSFDDVTAQADRLRAKEISRQQLDGLTVICYYSPLIRETAIIDGKTVNVQIAYRDGTVTVGYPLILGSY